uniref:nuclear factor of activated T-cells, cytoplasmic 4 n=1 Tax=Pristiophorus japonicus TaxID=55135 RepID=UPI00398F523D
MSYYIPYNVDKCEVIHFGDLEVDDSPAYSKGPSFTVNRPIGIPRHRVAVRPGMHSPPPRPVADGDTYESQPARLVHLGGCKVLACPSIQITSIAAGDREGGLREMELADEEPPELGGWWAGAGGEQQAYPYHQHRLGGLGPPLPLLPSGRDHLYLPLDPFGYRDCSLSPSSASSYSSPRGGWLSDAASSCGSASHLYDDVEPELSEAALRCALASPSSSPARRAWPGDEAWASPGSSPVAAGDLGRLGPRHPPSRPSSPCGKRRHSGPEAYPCYYGYQQQHRPPGSARPSPAPSPAPSRRGSVTDDEAPPRPPTPSSPLLLLLEAVAGDIPHKSRRTSQEQGVAAEEGEGEGPYPGAGSEEVSPSAHQLAKKEAAPMEYLTVPSPFVWSKARVGAHSPIFRASALPSLDWPLPQHYEQLELKIEVQPKTHHRAHYETEGSRGAVKATAGGHPVVKLQGFSEKPLTLQLFIGTADDRNLRPHAFYQVHRITGKMVATSSQEAVVSTTKVLEVSLLPENNMTANIDCAGILKLRNSDIELRKGETDIGRKNTRVKLVFRVHVPQPNGKVVSLQVTSVPIECSQRSAHELPQVESCNLTSGSSTGGEELLLTGSNFLPESKVVFIEKGPDGRPQWEVEAKINSTKSTEALIVAEVPPYHSQCLTRPAQVCLLVCNGKRKRSPCQCFQYLPVLVKEEPYEEFEVGPSSPLRSPGEYPPSLPAASLSDLGAMTPASPAVPLPSPVCPSPEPFGEPRLLPSPVSALPAFLLEAEWGKACELVPPGFGCTLAQSNHGRPLTQSDHAHPLTQSNHGHPLTQSDHGHPLTQSDHAHPLTQSNHGHPLTLSDHGHPLTQSDHAHPLTQSNHGHPLTQSNHGHPLTQSDHTMPIP